MKRVGLDIGSTTLKCVIIEGGENYIQNTRGISQGFRR